MKMEKNQENKFKKTTYPTTTADGAVFILFAIALAGLIIIINGNK